MADTLRGRSSMTPVVTIPSNADPDADSIDVIHHDINKTIGGPYDISFLSDYRWWVDLSKQINTDTVLMSGNFTDTSGPIDGTSDTVRYLCIKHTGLNEVGGSTSVNVYVSLDAGDPSSSTDAIVIGKDECLIIKPNGCIVNNLHAETSGNSIVVCEVVAAIFTGGGGGQ
jgi:hypothetical protein